MGKSTSSAPPPDPRLIEANIKSLGVQDKAIERIIANSDQLLPLQKAQLQQALEAAARAQTENAEDRRYALKKRGQLDRAQAPLLREANEFNETTRRADLYGEANADITQAFDGAAGQQTRALTRMGIRPTDGTFKSFVRQNTSDAALAKALAGRKVTEAARAEGLTLRRGAADMLAGYPGMASGLTGSGFGYGTAGVDITGRSLAGMNGGYGAASTAAGQMGANATGMYGAMGSYKNGQDQIAANSDPLNTILGASAAIGTKWALGKF